MHETLEFVLRHGYWVLFLWVLAEQFGVPIPSPPVLLAMGALVGRGERSLGTSMALIFVASISADFAWYFMGRRKGYSTLRTLCRISLEPDSCVSSTQDWFRRLGGWALVIGKFIPGVGSIAAPMAGATRMHWWKFLPFDGAGIVVWAGTYLGAGYLFRAQLEDVGRLASRTSVGLVAILLILAMWPLWKYWQRRQFLRSLRIARITPEEVMERLSDFAIVDLRSATELNWDGRRIPGAMWFDRAELAQRHHTIPRDKDIVLYCTCPNESTSARVALELQKVGITRVRPLAGGFEAWRDRGFPTEAIESAAESSMA